MWKPNEEFVAILLSMGISRNVAERVIFFQPFFGYDPILKLFIGITQHRK
jgi:hypothetical protein